MTILKCAKVAEQELKDLLGVIIWSAFVAIVSVTTVVHLGVFADVEIPVVLSIALVGQFQMIS